MLVQILIPNGGGSIFVWELQETLSPAPPNFDQ
jgi:hypothetical protein